MKLYEMINEEECCEWGVSRDTDIKNITSTVENLGAGVLLAVTSPKIFPTLNIINKRGILLINADMNAPDGIPYVKVKNVRCVAAYAASRLWRVNYANLKIIGVTGTNGKTSTATFIKRGLESGGIKTGFIGTGMISIGDKIISDPDYSMTTPDPWDLYRILSQMQEAGCGAVVMEVSSHALELYKVEPIVFEYAVFTNFSAEHLDFHITMENYFKAKKKLFRKCKKAVLNIDDPMADRLTDEYRGEAIKVGAVIRGNCYADCIKNLGEHGIEYLYHGHNFSFIMKLKTPGIYNVYNSMLAIAVCTDMGIKPVDVKRALSDIDVIPGRYEIIKDDITVIIDYAHTAAAFKAFLQNVRNTSKGKSKVIAVYGAGGERDREKRPKMAQISERYADLSVITADNSRSEPTDCIIADIVSGFTSGKHIVISDRESAIRESILSAKDGDTIAVVGKGCEGYIIDGNGYRPFNERQIIESALSERRRQAKNEN